MGVVAEEAGAGALQQAQGLSVKRCDCGWPTKDDWSERVGQLWVVREAGCARVGVWPQQAWVAMCCEHVMSLVDLCEEPRCG